MRALRGLLEGHERPVIPRCASVSPGTRPARHQAHRRPTARDPAAVAAPATSSPHATHRATGGAGGDNRRRSDHLVRGAEVRLGLRQGTAGACRPSASAFRGRASSAVRPRCEPQILSLKGQNSDETEQMKVFVLCDEVTPESGPLTFRPAAPSETLRGKAAYKYNTRLTDTQVRELLGAAAAPTAILGPAGTTAFLDTSRCFHFGSRCADASTHRLVVMLQYVTPRQLVLTFRKSAAVPPVAPSAGGIFERTVATYRRHLHLHRWQVGRRRLWWERRGGRIGQRWMLGGGTIEARSWQHAVRRHGYRETRSLAIRNLRRRFTQTTESPFEIQFSGPIGLMYK